MPATPTPGTSFRSGTAAPAETTIRCPDRFCGGNGGAIPAGYHIPLTGERRATTHRAPCSVCGNAIVVPLTPDVPDAG